MPLLNVSRVVSNPMFATSFSLLRSTGGDFATNGVWADTQTTVPMWGIVKPATAKELEQVPDGDRVKEVKSFHSTQQMFITHVDGVNVTDPAYSPGVSDIVVYQGSHYRLSKIYPWQDFGYYKALGVRIEGD
jgi:hypothetical protein